MSDTTLLREWVLDLVRAERVRQLNTYGTNADLEPGFGGMVSGYPWLSPYTHDDATEVEASFREDYEYHERRHGKPTWMHLIREEVAELFAAHDHEDLVAEAIQVAALCVSFVEHIHGGGVVVPPQEVIPPCPRCVDPA